MGRAILPAAGFPPAVWGGCCSQNWLLHNCFPSHLVARGAMRTNPLGLPAG